MIQRSQAAFRRDLPALLKNKKLFRHWIAYHCEERIGINKSADVLYRECLRRGLKNYEYVVRCIVPEIEDVDCTPMFDV